MRSLLMLIGSSVLFLATVVPTLEKSLLLASEFSEVQRQETSQEEDIFEGERADKSGWKHIATSVSSENEAEARYDYLALTDKEVDWKKLDKTAPIWVSTDRKYVALGGEICLREGALEFFACRRNSKEHESIVTLDVPPHLICAALLAIGAKPGGAAKYEPEFIPPSGEEIEIEARWLKNDEVVCARAQDFVLENESGKTMSASWVFTGGLFGVDPEGKKYYVANATGEVIGVSNFPGAVLDVPFESSSDNTELCFAPNTEKIPPIGSKVVLILSRKDAL